MKTQQKIKERFESLSPFFDEWLRRIYAAVEAKAIGYGGDCLVARETGVSRRAIAAGRKELQQPREIENKRVRKEGGGRKRTVETDKSLKSDLENLIDPLTRGDPESPLRWTCKSVRKLSEELKRMGHNCSHKMVAELLNEMGYSLQANSKTTEGG